MSQDENKWIGIATDYITQHTDTAALLKGTAQEVTKFCVHQVELGHGTPEVLITDC